MTDPYEAGMKAYAALAEEYGHASDPALRGALTAALIAERKRTFSYQLCRLRQKVIWFGGWERANCGGWRFRLEPGLWMDPFPLSLFGCITFYGWGLQVRLPHTFFVWTWRGDRGMYVSPDGTPNKATRWITRRPRWL
jgi:hypothetical protein